MNFDPQQLNKPISSVTVKRSLTPRRRAREYALQGIYQWLVIKAAGGFADYATIAKQLTEDPGFKKCQKELFDHLFSGVVNHFETLENHIQQHLDRPIAELSPVEYGALLIASYELAEDISVPFKVAINEAVELAKVFGGTDGHKYVNGVLDKLAQQLRPHETS
jgi:N utilization substance protein B